MSNVVATGEVVKTIKIAGIGFNEEKDIFEMNRTIELSVDGQPLLPGPVAEKIRGKISENAKVKAFIEYSKTLENAQPKND